MSSSLIIFNLNAKNSSIHCDFFPGAVINKIPSSEIFFFKIFKIFYGFSICSITANKKIKS